MSEHFGEAAFFAFVTIDQATNSVVEQRTSRTRTFPWIEVRVTGRPMAGVTETDVVLVKVDLTGRGPDYVLRDAGIEVQQAGRGS